MRVIWSNEAIKDLGRVRRFLAGVNPRAARQVFETLRYAPRKLVDHPRLGTKLDDFPDREVRRIVVGEYELRYEIAGDVIAVLRIWHGREDR